MAQNYTFDEIKARVIARGSKASKIDWLVKEAGYNPKDAEQTYRIIMMVSERPAVQHRTSSAIRFTMGVELECTNVNRSAIIAACNARGIRVVGESNYHHTNNAAGYEIKRDGSLCRNNGDAYEPYEVVTPVLRDLSSLKTVCAVLNEAGASANRSCGLHVHFGAASFTSEVWRRIAINYARIEGIIDGFMPSSRRGNNNEYCRSIRYGLSAIENNDWFGLSEIQSTYNDSRYHKVNFMAYNSHKTIEFRQHSGTTSFEKVEHWVKFLAAFLTYCINNTTLLTATCIDELPFLNAELKRYYNARTASLA